MKRFHARREVIKKLTDLGLFVETKDNAMQIPICRYAPVSISSRLVTEVEVFLQ
jgi:valyl-tRNA synthetase